ncbi:MAG: hypothetical protein ACFFDN_01400 [Candidatus Hodarchaeota archaeon]
MDKTDVSYNDFRSRATSIKAILRGVELKLQGHSWSSKGDKYIPVSDFLCGNSLINAIVGLLQPFAEESNLITIKSKEMFSSQKYEILTKINILIRKSPLEIPVENYSLVLTIAKTALQNIGDIILGSRNIIEDSLKLPDQNTDGMRLEV